MKLLTINYLSHTRPEYFSLTKKILQNISLENRSKIHLNILASRNIDWESQIQDLGISTSLYIVDENRRDNYSRKIAIAINSNTEYSCKLDEDCFINEHTWNFIIENIKVLDQEFMLVPTFTNNIPTADIFIEDFILESHKKTEIYNLFLKQKMPDGLWEVDYSFLDEFTIYSNEWNPKFFYEAVNKLNTDLKGIHPLRINYDAQVLINDYVLDNPDKLFNKQDYELKSIKSPYITNSFFFIKNSKWAEILKEIGGEEFDEVTINNYMRRNNKSIVYVKNGFGIHLMYNTVYGNKNKWGIGSEDCWIYEKEAFNKFNKIYDTLHRG